MYLVAMTAHVATMTAAALGAGSAQPPKRPCQPWQRQPFAADRDHCQGQRRGVVAAAKRRGPPKVGRSSAGGGGRGRVASRDRQGDARDRTALGDPSSAVRDAPRQRDANGGARPGGFGRPDTGRRRGRREGYTSEAEAEGGADWDEELLEDLSESGEPDVKCHQLQRTRIQLAASLEVRWPLMWGKIDGPQNTHPIHFRLFSSHGCPSWPLHSPRPTPFPTAPPPRPLRLHPGSPAAAAEVAELIGEEGGEDAAQLLAALEPGLRGDVEAVLGQFAFTLDPFQVRAVAELLGGKSGGPDLAAAHTADLISSVLRLRVHAGRSLCAAPSLAGSLPRLLPLSA